MRDLGKELNTSICDQSRHGRDSPRCATACRGCAMANSWRQGRRTTSSTGRKSLYADVARCDAAHRPPRNGRHRGIETAGVASPCCCRSRTEGAFPIKVSGTLLPTVQAAARGRRFVSFTSGGGDARHRSASGLRQVHARARSVEAPAADGRHGGCGGRNLSESDRNELRLLRKEFQIVFRTLASLDPRMTIGESIAEPLRSLEPGLPRAAVAERVRAIMEKVGLDPAWINRYPHEFSGGQNQRVGVARAMILRPKLIVCDEAVSALDVSIQAQTSPDPDAAARVADVADLHQPRSIGGCGRSRTA